MVALAACSKKILPYRQSVRLGFYSRVLMKPSNRNRRYLMKIAYKKPVLVAKNNPTGSFAAGCPAVTYGHKQNCDRCDRAQ